MQAPAVTDGSFGREVLGASVPVLVKFYAEGPSALAANAALSDIARQFEGRIRVASVDVGRSPAVKAEYEIRGLPTLILFKNGMPVARRIGGQATKEELEEWVRSALVAVLASRRTSAARSGATFKLPNGMLGVVIPDHRAPIVTHMVCYRVGAGDEPQGLSGIAHFLALLTHKSMEKATVGGFAKTISRLGGEHNASTDRNATMYYERISKEHLRLVMEMGADRMAQLNLTDHEVAVEREVFMEVHREAREAGPINWLFEEVDAAHYRGHRHGIPLIGSADEAAKITLDDVSRFHKLHYAPNNAVLVVAGDVTLDEVQQLARATYGGLPANPEAGGRLRPSPPAHIADHRVAVENSRTGTSEFYRRYAIPNYTAAKPGEAEALEVLTRVLAGGAASRLYRKLAVEDKSASAVNGGYHGHVVDSGFMWLRAIASNGDLGALEAGVDAVLADIRKNGVGQQELETAKAALIAAHIYDGSDQLKLATRYGLALAIGITLDEIEGWPAAISKVTAPDVKKVASTYLTDRRAVTGWLVPDQRVWRSELLGRVQS